MPMFFHDTRKIGKIWVVGGNQRDSTRLGFGFVCKSLNSIHLSSSVDLGQDCAVFVSSVKKVFYLVDMFVEELYVGTYATVT